MNSMQKQTNLKGKNQLVSGYFGLQFSEQTYPNINTITVACT